MDVDMVITRGTIQKVALVAHALGDSSICDIRGALEYVNRLQTWGPYVDPTSYRDNIDNLRDTKDLLEAALTFQKAIEPLLPKIRMGHEG